MTETGLSTVGEISERLFPYTVDKGQTVTSVTLGALRGRYCLRNTTPLESRIPSTALQILQNCSYIGHYVRRCRLLSIC